MIKRPFREHHLFILLETYDQQHLPLDLCMSNYFRAHKALGPKDRGFLAETAYALVRWKGLLDFLGKAPITWEQRYALFQSPQFEASKGNSEIPLHIRGSIPKILFDLLAGNYGPEKALGLCRISNKPAPTTIRINALKTSREAMFKRWKEVYDISLCSQAKYGVVFHKKINFFGLAEFKEGLFEVQDEGSQLLAALVQAKPGEQIMDYCSGSGGKTLAFAPLMENKGQIFLHDIRPFALAECKKRLRRAGIQNAQIIQAEDPKLKKLKKRMDWVLVDAPCSGTGTMRRNPDMKWDFTEETLPRLVGQQRMIFEKALSYMSPDGRIIYATCSILKEENEDQIAHFLRTYELELDGKPFQSLPEDGKMDGFYGAVLRKITLNAER